MRFRLRTLMIVLTLGPPVLAGLWFIAKPVHRLPADPGHINWSTTTASEEVRGILKITGRQRLQRIGNRLVGEMPASLRD